MLEDLWSLINAQLEFRHYIWFALLCFKGVANICIFLPRHPNFSLRICFNKCSIPNTYSMVRSSFSSLNEKRVQIVSLIRVLLHSRNPNSQKELYKIKLNQRWIRVPMFSNSNEDNLLLRGVSSGNTSKNKYVTQIKCYFLENNMYSTCQYSLRIIQSKYQSILFKTGNKALESPQTIQKSTYKM